MKNCIIFLFVFISYSLGAQDSIIRKAGPRKPLVEKKANDGEDAEDKKTNFFTGGSLSFGLSNYGFNAGIHPHYGYTIAKWIDVAAVANFEYNAQRDPYDNKYRNTTIGIGAFTRIYPVRFAFLQVQPEYNFISQKFLQNGGPTFKSHLKVPSLLLGIGYTPSRSDKNTFSYFTLMIDVLKKLNSPYVDGYGKSVPVIRAGFNFGLFRKKREF